MTCIQILLGRQDCCSCVTRRNTIQSFKSMSSILIGFWGCWKDYYSTCRASKHGWGPWGTFSFSRLESWCVIPFPIRSINSNWDRSWMNGTKGCWKHRQTAIQKLLMMWSMDGWLLGMLIGLQSVIYICLLKLNRADFNNRHAYEEYLRGYRIVRTFFAKHQ